MFTNDDRLAERRARALRIARGLFALARRARARRDNEAARRAMRAGRAWLTRWKS